MSYAVKHLHTGASFKRPYVFLNGLEEKRSWQQSIDPAIETFHETLPHYSETKLHSLPSVAAELGIGHVLVKDESTRFGLPSFKILGASWAIHQALCQRLSLQKSTSLDDVVKALRLRNGVRLVTCTEGNWGRACARMAKYLSIPITIYVAGFMNAYTQGLLRGEGADVKLLADGSYDDTIAAVRKDAKEHDSMMVLDTSWEGFVEVPQWVTDGYSTMLRETDRQVEAQTGGKSASMVFVSVGVGSWAHAVAVHFKSRDESNRIITVEPLAAPCLKESLHCGKLTSIETGETIMNGMNCGTPSTIAWPVLRDGTHAAVAVTDVESHEAVQYLQSQGVNAGPCGAATLAALKKFSAVMDVEKKKDAVVVLFSTEGMREYETPE